MEIIPVIDLMGGRVVHACRGQRETYRPINSRLCEGADPVSVARGFLRLHAFRTMYIADLDALMGRPGQMAIIRELMATFPDIRFWIDPGQLLMSGRPGCLADHGVPVIGSESLDAQYLHQLENGRKDFILSLDSGTGGFIGPPLLLEKPWLWPERVILMSLDRVGTHSGPDVEQVIHYRKKHPGHLLVAAGGVRNAADLKKLREAGAYAALVSSALHSGEIGDGAMNGIRPD